MVSKKEELSMKRFGKVLLIVTLLVWLSLASAFCHDAFAEELPIAQAVVVVTNGDLNGRSLPSLEGLKVAWFQNGSVIDLYELEGDWAKTIGGEAYFCWVNVRYLITADAGQYTIDASGRVWIRSKPSTSSKRCGSLKSGAVVGVFGIFGEWAFTEKGWVMTKFLRKEE
jgi:hypothetical protein